MSIDIARARAETPGVRHVVHLNNAGAGLMPQCVVDALKRHLDLEAETGGYEAAAIAEPACERTYVAIAELLNAAPDEIALVENATVAWLQAFHAFARDMRSGDKIVTVEAEYASNYISYLQLARERGIEVVVAPSGADGAVDVDAMAGLMDDRVKLVSATHVPTNGGLVNPAAAIGRVARDAGVPFLLDACQSAGQLPLDVEEIGCAALSVTGRKYLRGPRGTGFLYIRRDWAGRLQPPFLDLHAATWTGPDAYELATAARRFENWEFYVAGVVGLGVAVDYALAWGMNTIHERIVDLAEYERRQLAAIKGVCVTDIGDERCGIVTFAKEGVASQDIKAALARHKINVSVSTRSSTMIDMDRRGLDSVVRASVHYYNDEGEIDRLCEVVEDL